MFWTWFFAVWLVTGLLYWLNQFYSAIRIRRSVNTTADLPLAPSVSLGRVSILMPARNESASLDQAVRSRLADTRADIELILIDDRSTDDTRQIATRLAAEDTRIKLVTIDHLPQGWLGKMHALHQGMAQAKGEWLVFSDADVQVQPRALDRMIYFCDQHQLDLLAVLPEVYPSGMLVDATVSFFLRFMAVAGRIWTIGKPGSHRVAGSGAFSLVRAAVFKETPGFEHLKMELLDDLAMGQMLQDVGARCGILNGNQAVGLSWYHSIHELFEGIEKSSVGLLSAYRTWPLILLAVLLHWFELAPLGVWAGLCLEPAFLWPAAALFLIFGLAMFLIQHWLKRSLTSLLLWPIGVILLCAAALRAAFLWHLRGGVRWRGTLYQAADLQKGRRYRSWPRPSNTKGA